MTSTVLPRARRIRVGVALLLMVAALLVLAVLRWQAPMIGTAAAGLPLLFACYVRGTGYPSRALSGTALLGAVLGLGWALAAGAYVAQGYDVALGSGDTVGRTVLDGFAIPASGAVVMMLPAVVVRLASGLIRNPLDGLVFGSSGAMAFAAVTTMTRLSPQLATGVSAPERPVLDLLAEALIQGVAVPVMAAAAGGMVGAALGFRRRRGLAVTASALVAVILYGCLGVLEAQPLSQVVQVGGHLGLVALTLVALRTVLRAGSGAPAGHAPRDVRVLLPAAVGIVLVAAATSAVSLVVTAEAPNYRCPPDCGGPPIGTPVAINPRFTAADGSFSVSYPGPGTAYRATLNPDGVTLDFVAGDTGTVELFGQPAGGRTPRAIAEELITRSYPDAVVDYEIPNAAVGYQPGFGVFADDYPQDSTGTYTRLRIMVMVAIKHDLALVAAAVGPYHEFSPSFGIGHPSGANLQLAMDVGKYVNSFTWTGDPPR